MVGSITAFTLLSTLVVQFAAAMPFAELTTHLPRDITHVALDERSNEYIAFKRDGSLYGRYLADPKGWVQRRGSVGTCSNLTVDEAQTLPGWNAITKYADDTWGKGSRKVVTNPDDYPGSPAEVCVPDEPVELTYNGPPKCQTHNLTVTGDLEGTTGRVTLEIDQGSAVSSSLTVSKSSTIGVSNTLSVSVGFAKVAEVSDSLTISTEVTNTRTSSFNASQNDVSKFKLEMESPDGKTCDALDSVTSCTLQATGKIQYLATGWIWFNYDSSTKGHYKWAASIDSILTNEDDRSSYAEVKGPMNTETHAKYKGTCK